MTEPRGQLLKADLFGRVERVHLSEQEPSIEAVRRELGAARWWVRWLARWMARREQRALRQLSELSHGGEVPEALGYQSSHSERSWLDGRPMQLARPVDPAYFEQARRLLARMHRLGVTHNDLAKEPNWLVTPSGQPALVDFQLACVHRRRTRRFRMQGREDLRHLLKHKRTYCPERLTVRERAILASPSWVSRTWRRTGKPVYLFITRGVLGWSDREGAGDRNDPSPPTS